MDGARCRSPDLRDRMIDAVERGGTRRRPPREADHPQHPTFRRHRHKSRQSVAERGDKRSRLAPRKSIF